MSVLLSVTVYRSSWVWPLKKEVVIMSEQHFAIQLEDYSLPDILPFPKTYYGTLPQIGALMDCLVADPDTAIRFASTIRAFNDYKAGHLGAVHEVCGRTFRLLTPVNQIHETVILDQNVQWDFENGAYHHRVRADFVDLHQVLLQDGDMYLRVVRPCYEGLQYEDAYERWTSMPACNYGFPYMYEAEPGWHYARLYTLEQVEVSAAPCLIRMHDSCYVSHHEACNDLFGGREVHHEE